MPGDITYGQHILKFYHMKEQKIELLLFDSYISSIKNSAGTKIFRNLYADMDGKRKDITENGGNSCALFVSSILVMFGLLKRRHATVKGTLESMKRSGWTQIKRPKMGAALIWSPWKESSHWHTGFYIGDNKAISNGSEKGVPAKHHWTYGTKNGKPKRPAESIWWHKSLDN